MRNSTRSRGLGTIAIAGALALSAGPAVATAAAAPAATAYTCTGGDIPSGTYAKITVTGHCEVPADAVISVVGNVDVAAGAVLDAQSAPSTITVGRNVTAAADSLLGLGCQPPSYTGTGNSRPRSALVEPEAGTPPSRSTGTSPPRTPTPSCSTASR